MPAAVDLTDFCPTLRSCPGSMGPRHGLKSDPAAAAAAAGGSGASALFGLAKSEGWDFASSDILTPLA